MDPSMQEFYSLSRSTSQERPLSQIISTSHNRLPSRSSSRQQLRPASASVYAWSLHHPMSVPSIAQLYLQPNYQDGGGNLMPPPPHHTSSHRRHHTSGANSGYFQSAVSAAATEAMSMKGDNTDSIQTDSPGKHTQRDSSIYTPEDEANFLGGPTGDDSFPPREQLEDIDDYGRAYSFHQTSESNPGSFNNNDETYGNNSGGGGADEFEANGVQGDDTSMLMTPEKPTPLPKIPLFVLSIVIFSEPLTSTILFPFVYFMVRDFHITENEDEIGFYCGLIASSFFFAQFCTSIFWGYMSDRYGRRPILLLGLCGSTIACIFFGLSKSLIWAITSRSMCGLLNGNVGVAKSMLGEIADRSNQSQAFSIFGFAWGIGMIIGPVLGGYLANPAQTFPDTFGQWSFFIEYPYFLPCFVAAMGSVVGFLVGYFFLEETRGREKVDNDEDPTLEDDVFSNYQNDNPVLYSSYGNGDALSEGNDGEFQSVKPNDAARTASPVDVDLERQPLMMPQNASLPQQVKFANRRGMGRSTQYGSMITLALETGEVSANQFPNTHTSASARSTLSLRPIATRPSIYRYQQGTSPSGTGGMSNSYVDRPLSGRQNSFYASRPMSSGGLFSLADPSLQATIPADATSLSFYGYTSDSFLDVNLAGPELDRRSRLSVAPSQVFVLPPDPKNKDPNQPLQLLVVQSEAGLSPLSITTILAYAMLALHSIVFEEVYTLYVVTPLNSHGLGWNAIQLSTSLASMGIVQLFMQFVVYPQMQRRFSAVSLFRCAQLMYVGLYLTFPMIRAFAVDESNPETGGQISRVRILVLTGLVFKYFCSVFSYTSVMVMINNSSPPHLLGTVNGIGQTSASFMRAVGPALGGVIWAWSLSNKLSFPFNYFFVFFLMATIAALTVIHSLSIPSDLGRSRY